MPVTYSKKSSFRVVFFQEVNVVVDECDATASAATELAGETLNGDAVLLTLQLFDELIFDLGLGDGWHLWVDHLDGLRKKRYVSQRRRHAAVARALTHCFLPKSGFLKNLRMYRMNFPSAISAFI